MNNLTQEELKERLDYNPDTGLFTWKEHPNNSNYIKVGGAAGTLNKRGYIRIGINFKLYYAHRLAWLFMTGSWPKSQIDHRNRVRDDNRFCNLREATNAENVKNCSLYKSNTSGYRGVYWRKDNEKWVAQIRLDGKPIYLGCFTTPELANEAAIQARKKYFGEFA